MDIVLGCVVVLTDGLDLFQVNYNGEYFIVTT